VAAVAQERRVALGAQVRRSGGRSEMPDWSRKQSQAPRLSPPPVILGHSWARQRAMAASSRSAARRAGRWGLQPSRRSSRHTCPGW
jgi:hypothetical protein